MPVIHRLSEEVINSIAAGEVVQRPSAALKELLENSLDAHADEINVIASDGGLTYLQVRDNGCGVGYDDLPLLCARHATSKLKSVEELHSITSFGFRGEALASLSYVAKVKVITRMRVESVSPDNMCPSQLPVGQSLSCSYSSYEDKTYNNTHINAQVAWEAHYCNGLLSDEPIPVAGNYGTTIIAESMFYNTPVRLKSIKPTEEWNRLREVVVKYAFAFPFVGFYVQRINRSQLDPANSLGSTRNSRSSQELDYLVFPKHSTTRRNLELAFTNTISSHLHLIAFTTFEETCYIQDKKPQVNINNNNRSSKIYYNYTRETSVVNNDEYKTQEEEEIINDITCSGRSIQKLSFEEGTQQFALWGYVSDSFVMNNRKHYLSLFVNNRLVECHAVRKMLDSLYSSVSVNNNSCKYVVVLMLYLPCSRVDVNIHPTKQEVRIFDELFVVTKISEIIRETISEITSMIQPLNSALIANSNIPASIAALSSTVNLKSEILTITQKNEYNSLQCVNKTNEANSSIAENSNSNSMKGKNKNSCNNTNVQATMLNTNEFMKNTSFTLPPSCMVRIEPQKGALDRYVQTMNNKAISNTESNNDNNDNDSCATESKELDVRETEIISNVQTEVSAPAVEQVDTTHTATHTHSMKRCREESCEDFNDNEGILQEEKKTVECKSEKNSEQGNKIYTTAAVAIDEDDDMEEDSALMLKEFKQFQEKVCINEKWHNNNDDDHDDHDDSEEQNTINNSKLRGEISRKHHNVDQDDDDGNNINRGTQAKITSETSNIKREYEEQSEQEIGSDNVIEESLAEPKKEVLVLLTSVERIVHAILDESSNTIQQFFANMSFVGVVNSKCFLVQVNTTLYMVCTFRIVREAIYQRLFMQWASAELSLTRAPSFTLSIPLSVSDLLYHTLAFDTSALWPPSPLLYKLIEQSTLEVNSTSQNKDLTQKIQQEWNTYKHISSTPLSSFVMRNLLFHVDENIDLINESIQASNEYCGNDNRINILDFDKKKAEEQEVDDGKSCKKEKQFALESEQLKYHLTPTLLTRKYVQRLTRRLRHWSEMLSEYFGIVFHTFSAANKLESENENKAQRQKKWKTYNLYLLSLPAGLNLRWRPTLHLIPLFVWQLAERVPYPSETYNKSTLEQKEALEINMKTDPIDDEVKCFRAIAHCIASTLYKVDEDDDKEEEEEKHKPKTQKQEESATLSSTKNNDIRDNNMNSKSIEHVLLPCVQNAQLFKPPARFLTDRTIQSVVSVETLYKIFERC